VKRVLITGGAGFMGYHLTRRLVKEGWEIDLIDNLSRGSMDREFKALIENSGVNFFQIDLLKDPDLSVLSGGYSYIYHFAAIIGVKNVLERPFDVLRDNTLMLLKIISFARGEGGLRRFIFTSTSEVYAGTLRYFDLPIPTPEDTPLALTDLRHPRTSYMLSKIYGEALLHHSGLPFTIVRPHNIYGPRMGMAHVIPELLKKAHLAEDGGTLEVYSTTHRRTFCYIDDFIEMIKDVAESSRCRNETLNIGNQSPEITVEELARLIIEVTGKDLRIAPMPETTGSPPRRCPDMTKTFRLIDYRPGVDIKRGIELTYAWYRENAF